MLAPSTAPSLAASSPSRLPSVRARLWCRIDPRTSARSYLDAIFSRRYVDREHQPRGTLITDLPAAPTMSLTRICLGPRTPSIVRGISFLVRRFDIRAHPPRPDYEP